MNHSLNTKIGLALGLISLQAIYGCPQNEDPVIAVRPESFKMTIPFEINTTGIIIDTYWGADKIRHELLWDNHSPTWANGKVIRGNKSISKSKKTFYSTTTADGSIIRGNVYRCDSISLGPVTFSNVPFYNISDQMEGVFGENLITKGAWEINFKEQTMTFASSIDSLKDLDQAEIFPSNFTDNAIKISAGFRNNKTEDLEVDFGFNGLILLPGTDFIEISKGNKAIRKGSLRFSTPGSKNVLEVTEAYDSIQIQKNNYRTIIATNKLVKEKLIGRGFFVRFEFVIFDYKNQLFYVSRKKLGNF